MMDNLTDSRLIAFPTTTTSLALSSHVFKDATLVTYNSIRQLLNNHPNFSKLKLLLYDQRLLSPSHCLGQAELDLTLCTDHENGFRGEVTLENDRKEVVGLLNLHIKRRDLTQDIDSERARIALEAVDKSAAGMTSPPQTIQILQDGIEAVDKVQQSVDALTGLSTRLVTLVESLETFIHPYASAAWNLLTFAVKMAGEEVQLDQSINTLIDTMHEMYAILVEMQLWRNESQRAILVQIAVQTKECGLLVKGYLEERQKSGFGQDLALSDIPYIEGFRYTSRPGCLRETRVAILNEIEGFLYGTKSDNIKRVILLAGGAGTGKSAIAHTIAERFDKGLRLGSSCFFDSTIPMRRDAVAVFRIIARDLASLDQNNKAKLWEKKVKENQAIRTTVSIREQFENFILKPAETLSLLVPIVIVMNALDECDDWKQLLEIFAAKMSKLPHNFRFLLTARPEDDILKRLQILDCVHVMRMDECTDKSSTNEDIERFIWNELQTVSSKLDRQWPNGSWVARLAESSGSLFLWASTACSFIKPSARNISAPVRQFNALVSNRGIIGDIDDLYQKVLGLKFSNQVVHEEILSNFKTLMKKILAAKIPLSRAALNVIFNDKSISEITEEILPHLGAFLTGTDEMTSLIQFHHFSFKEFLTDARRGKQFFIGEDTHSVNHEFALASLKIMNALKPDICSLMDPMALNPQTGEIQQCMDNWEAVVYACCCFWAVHLEASDVPMAADTQATSTSMNSLSAFLKKVSVGNWQNYLKLTVDVKRMLMVFHPLVSEHSLQIYHSAILFTPRNTELFKQYGWDNPLPHELLYPPSDWQALLCIMMGHTASVNSVVFSPQDDCLASCSYDGTVCLWDSQTGKQIGEAMTGHTGSVYSVVFTPQGDRLASCSHDGTIRLWDSQTGKQIGEAMTEQTGSVYSVVFSPQGDHLACCSDDGTLCLWDGYTGLPILNMLADHIVEPWIQSLDPTSISPDGWLLFSDCPLLWIPYKRHGVQSCQMTNDELTICICAETGMITFIKMPFSYVKNRLALATISTLNAE
ncbi:hypothetical protein M422DRAFT_264252 [Sphaerobolus stellatus SS14]|uniref:Nephrocystin 3-like N-terminal domain-containing protein n=1 Tax=Sphaerobolus stellatus (strain SS14) TaxID=990650 RepID=A0A0C9TTU5_SPHS4|nr:hypothetical protein M422DRAFT_264252 [Sphaerobolus stellatus SS14]